MALPLVLFLHLDIVRQMRRHAIDEYMKCVVCVNADMFGFLVGFFVLVSIIAVAQGDNMEAEEGGGGGGRSVKAGEADDDEEMGGGEGRGDRSVASNKRTVQGGAGGTDDDGEGAGGGGSGERGTVAGGGGARPGGGADDGDGGGLGVGGDAEGQGGPRPFSDEGGPAQGWGRTINPNADAAPAAERTQGHEQE